MKKIIPAVAILALATAAVTGCDRAGDGPSSTAPRTGGTAYNNSGSSATPGSVPPLTSPQVVSTPWTPEVATAAQSSPTTPGTASPNAPPSGAVPPTQDSAATAK